MKKHSGGFKGNGNSLDGMEKPGSPLPKQAPKAKVIKGGFGGGKSINYPGEYSSLPKK